MDRTVLANPSQSTVRVFQIFLGTQQLLLLQAGDNSACQSTSILLRVFSGFPTSYPGDLFAFTGFLHSARGHHPPFLLLLLLWSPLWHRRLLSLHWISWTRWQPPTQETTLPSPRSSPYSRNAFHKTKCNKSPEKKGPKMPNIKSTKCLSVGMCHRDQASKLSTSLNVDLKSPEREMENCSQQYPAMQQKEAGWICNTLCT